MSARICFVALMLVGICLRLYNLDGQSLWSDEGIQYFVSSGESITEVLARRAERTFHNPLSFLINHAFLQIHDSDFFLRLPSALFGIGTLPLVYWLAHYLFSRPAALCALFVIAISPFHIWYSQEARMYTPLLFAALLSTLFLLKALERGKAIWWILYVLGTVFGLFFHIFMVLNVMVHALWLLLFHRRALLTVIACGLIAAILAFPVTLPWTKTFFYKLSLNTPQVTTATQGSRLRKERIKIGWQGIPYAVYAYGAGFSLGPSVTELHENRHVSYLLRFLPSILAVGVIWGSLLILGAWVLLTSDDPPSLWLCLLGLGGTLAGVVLLTTVTHFTFNVRYTIIAYPYCVFLVGVALAFLLQNRRWLGTLAPLALTVLSVVSLLQYYHHPRYAKEDIRAAVHYWRQAPTLDFLLSYSPAGGTADVIDRYLTHREKAHHIRLSKGDTIDDIHHFFQTYKRPFAYILFVRDWHQKRESDVRKSFRLYDEQVFPGVQIMKIVPK
ncbi:MAG TPA: glycosyltransferase family 39 protein [Candidatus Binatia bacterium]|nr:glycosyltransferase family 39 protein [Candidatus Binatia bacterium]